AARAFAGTVASVRPSKRVSSTSRTVLDALRSSGRGVRDGAGGGASAADETCRQNLALVRHWFWDFDHPFRLVEGALVVARLVVSYRGIRQCERDHPWFHCATDHAGWNARPRFRGEQYFYRHIE